MTLALNTLAVQNAALMRELAKEGPAETVSAIARRIGRDESNVRKSIKALIAEGLADEPMRLTVEGEAQLAAIARAEGQGAGGEPGSSAEGILSLVHAQILPDPANDRRDWDSDEARDELDNLRQDIVQNGLLQNLIVRAVAPDDLQGVSIEARDPATGDVRTLPLYRLVAGERRWRAVGEAITDGDWDPSRTIPCRLLETDDLGHRLAALAENLQRRNLNPIEKARAFEGLADAGLSNQQIADRISATPEHVQQHRRFLQLDEADQQRMTLAKDDPRHLSVREARQKLAKKSEEPEAVTLDPMARLAWIELTDAAYRFGRYSNLWNDVVVAPDADVAPEATALIEVGAVQFNGICKYGDCLGRFTAKRHYSANAVRIDPPFPSAMLEGDEARTACLRAEQQRALGDAAPEWPEGSVTYATPWLADVGEMTPEGVALVEEDKRLRREREKADQEQEAAAEARRQRWAAARERHIELFAEAVTGPVWGEPAQTIEIATAIDRPLPWSVTALGKVQDAKGQEIVQFGHYRGCSDQGLVTARMIVAAVNAAGGLATPAGDPEPEDADEPEQDIDGNDPDAVEADDEAETFDAEEAAA